MPPEEGAMRGITAIGMALLATACGGEWSEARRGVLVETWACGDSWPSIPIDGRFPVAMFCDQGSCSPASTILHGEDWWEPLHCHYGSTEAELVVARIPFAPAWYELDVGTVPAESGVPLQMSCVELDQETECTAQLGRLDEGGDLETGFEGTWATGYQLIDWTTEGIVQRPSCDELQQGLEPQGALPLVYLCDDGAAMTGCSQRWTWTIVDGLFSNQCGSSYHPDIVVRWVGEPLTPG